MLAKQAAAEGEGGTGGEGGADVAAPEQETLTVRGQFVQGTADGEPLAGDLPVEMYALDVHGQPIGLYNTVSQDDGSFVFEDVPRAIGNMYFVRTDYAGLPQGAQIPSIRGDEEELEVEVTLYERTTDSGSVAITRAQMLVNYAPINEFGIEVRFDVKLLERNGAWASRRVGVWQIRGTTVGGDEFSFGVVTPRLTANSLFSDPLFAADGYDGFFSIEPHLGDFDAFGGLCGPDLWTTAYDAITGIFREQGISWR